VGLGRCFGRRAELGLRGSVVREALFDHRVGDDYVALVGELGAAASHEGTAYEC